MDGWKGRWRAGKVSEQVEEGREDWMDELIREQMMSGWLAGEAGGMVKCLRVLPAHCLSSFAFSFGQQRWRSKICSQSLS